MERTNDHLVITLDRAEARNAIDTLTRDGLIDALAIAAFDSSITSVGFHGAGPDFCADGDLREFGTTTNPATALAVRLTSHPGLAADRIADRLTAHLHGNCIGAGVEVPAFAHHLVAHPDTTVSLPELSLGLVPSAGGTCSIARRIGPATHQLARSYRCEHRRTHSLAVGPRRPHDRALNSARDGSTESSP